MQSSTVALFNSIEHNHYDPMIPAQEIELAEIAVAHRFLYRWSCAGIESITV
jgi:hypothetical protein